MVRKINYFIYFVCATEFSVGPCDIVGFGVLLSLQTVMKGTVACKAVDEETKLLDEYEYKFLRNLKYLVEFEERVDSGKKNSSR